MRVVFILSSSQLGGAERSLLDTLASLRAAEPTWSLHLIAPDDGPAVVGAAQLGVETSVVAFPRALARLGDAAAGGPAGVRVGRAQLLGRMAAALPAVGGYVRRLRRALAAARPDVVHTNGLKLHVLAGVACPRAVPVVWHIHDHVGERPLAARLLRARRRSCAAIVANSESVAREARQVCGAGIPIVVVYNAVDLASFSPTGAALDLDALAGLPAAPAGTVRVGLVATLARWKGHEVFLEALSLLPRELPVRGYIVGGAIYVTDGSQHSAAELAARAHALGVGGRVGLTGYVGEPAAAMRALDVVVHASTTPEPFGLVIAEAMACGRALIASEAGGAAELIDVERDALAHRPGDAATLAACIERLVRDAALRRRLGAAGRATAERRFDRARLAAELVPVYRAAIAGGG